jgi:polyisoprenoid-binding protein YceI
MRFSFASKELPATQVAKRNFKAARKKGSPMTKKFSRFGLVALTGIFSVASASAQNSVSQIDSEHSTARLYLASTKNPDANLNVGVARTSGLVKINSGDSATPDFDFTIYPADKKESLAKSTANRRAKNPNYTVIAFKSRRVVPLVGDTYRVSGDLTLTYVQQTVSYDPSEGYSGPTYGPSITISETEPASFEFRRATPSANSTKVEWIASSTIHAEDFPQLLAAVSSTVWPVFVADEKCTMPSNVGSEDYSGPACTGERVDVAARKDLRCDTPLTVGEDFSGEVCTQVAPSITTVDQGQTLSAKYHHQDADPNHLVANEVQIHLDLFTTGSGSTVSAAAGQ